VRKGLDKEKWTGRGERKKREGAVFEGWWQAMLPLGERCCHWRALRLGGISRSWVWLTIMMREAVDPEN
jgi:hypothetical protein